jgi:hypothetical protein
VAISLRDLKVAPTDASGLVAASDVSDLVAAAFRLRLFGSAIELQPPPQPQFLATPFKKW